MERNPDSSVRKRLKMIYPSVKRVIKFSIALMYLLCALIRFLCISIANFPPANNTVIRRAPYAFCAYYLYVPYIFKQEPFLICMYEALHSCWSYAVLLSGINNIFNRGDQFVYSLLSRQVSLCFFILQAVPDPTTFVCVYLFCSFYLVAILLFPYSLNHFIFCALIIFSTASDLSLPQFCGSSWSYIRCPLFSQLLIQFYS